MKIFHFQLSNGRGKNLSTLVCNLNAGSIDYTYYSGHSSSGCPLALSNLQCVLPVFKEDDKETKEQFTDRVENIINRDSDRRVTNRVNENTFEENEDEANARLIASAPDLFAQCKLFERVLAELQMQGETGVDEQLTKMREILAKVDGGEG